MQAERVNSRRVVEELRELAGLTGGPDGARRVAWTDKWVKARDWLKGKLEEIGGVEVERDEAGNLWATAPGDSERAVLLGGHIDSVPQGGWLDGALNTVAALEVMRALAPQQRPVTLRLVDWADEEGARFGRSLTGSAASAGSLDPHKELAHLVDRAGVKLPDALKENGITLDGMKTARKYFDELRAEAYLELHIEQGPVLQEMKRPVGVVLGTMGVERHHLKFIGQAAHSGAAPLHLRQDAFLAGARFALAAVGTTERVG